MDIVEFQKDDRVPDFFIKRWGSDFIVSGTEKLYGKDLPGFVALENEQIIGLLTYHIKHNECEIVTLDSLKPNLGIGTKLIEAIVKKAKNDGIFKLWLMTTNDNINSIKFYQKRGFVFSRINIDAIKKSRELGQPIPEKGYFGIPIRDEVEFKYPL